MTPEKTHSQNPCCLPSWEERQVWPQQPPPPVEGLASFSTEMVFGCHSPIFFFPLESFLCFCSPSCLLASLGLYLQLPCS